MTTGASSTVTGSIFFPPGVKYVSSKELKIPRLTTTPIAGKTRTPKK